MNALKLVAALVVVSVLLLFGAQNTQAVTLHLFVFKVQSVPIVLALFVAALLGAFLGWIVSAPGRFRRMQERRGLQGELKARRQVEAAQDLASSTHSPDAQPSEVRNHP